MSIPIPDAIIQRYMAGESAVSLAAEIGIHGGTLGKRLRALGVRTRGPGERGINLPAEAVDLYLDGMCLADVARRFDCPRGTVRRLLRGAGIRQREEGSTYRYIPQSIYDRYVGGETAQNLARELGIGNNTFGARLRARSIPVRASSDYLVGPSPMRGRKRSEAVMARTAKTRELNCSNSSATEDRLAAVLDVLGIEYIRQKAIGRYNVDFALPERCLVLEVTNAWHRTGQHNRGSKLAHDAERRSFIERCGWTYTEIAEPFDHLLHFAVAA